MGKRTLFNGTVISPRAATLRSIVKKQCFEVLPLFKYIHKKVILHRKVGANPLSYYESVYALVAQIPLGKVATYRQLAMMTGRPRAARAVSYAMRYRKDPNLPCHRVTGRQGVITQRIFGLGIQRELLEAEGVPFTPDGRVMLNLCHWEGA